LNYQGKRKKIISEEIIKPKTLSISNIKNEMVTAYSDR